MPFEHITSTLRSVYPDNVDGNAKSDANETSCDTDYNTSIVPCKRKTYILNKKNQSIKNSNILILPKNDKLHGSKICFIM